MLPSPLRALALVVASVAAPLAAYDNIDARTAYAMVAAGSADLVDTRTVEEAFWVGSPADADGKPLATLIPWEAMAIALDGTVSSTPNTRFAELFARTFPAKDRPVVLMCRSGGRSAAAAKLLESLGYSRVYNLDSPRAKGDEGAGVGGFQGSAAKDGAQARYRGYPGRVAAEEAVSWLDAGLPITQKLDPAKIPH